MKTKVIPYLITVILFVCTGSALPAGYEGASNTFLGQWAGHPIRNAGGTGTNNTFLGVEAGSFTDSGSSNIFIGTFAGTGNETGSDNVYIGADIGGLNLAGNQNTIIGNGAGFNLQGSGNVFLGYQAGADETGNNKLYIDNSGITTPLIYGEFDTNMVTINGRLGVGTDPDPVFPLTVAGYIKLTSGGIVFPDATVQTTAGGGDITGVAAGMGLTGGGTTGSVTLNVSFSGSGIATTASRSDHTHTEADITGTVSESRIDPLIARDSELSAHTARTDNPHGVTAAQVGAADALHNHDADYINVTGDTVNGDLLVNGIVDVDQDLYVVGNMYLESDANAKKDIVQINSSLDKIGSIRGVSFSWKNNERGERKDPGSRHYGVIAQEVEEVLPELVTQGKNGMKKVAYIELIPMLIEAVKEQQQTISALSQKVTELERELKLRSSVAMVEAVH